MILPPPLRKAAYAFTAVYGLFATVTPRAASKLTARMGLLGFDNAGELEAKDWYVRAVRAAGVGMLAAGGVGLLLEGRAGGDDSKGGDGGDSEGGTDASADTTGSTDDDDGPVELDV